MSIERLYGWNGEMPAKEVSGQAAIVLRGLRDEPEMLRGGHAWAEIIGPNLKTRQDPYRVVLYYILILKSKGCIRTNEFDINATTRVGDTKHGITVKTEASVVERIPAPEPIVEAEIVEPATEESFDEASARIESEMAREE